MTTAARAGAVYFLAVFIVAFMVGAFRVIVVAPRLGEVMAVSLEAPVILIVSWVASRWATAKFAVSADRSARLLMGAVAFSLLLLAELALAVFAFGFDGVYIGATWAREMRNLMMLSLLIFLAAWLALRSSGNAGLWGALLVHYAARGGLQALRYPAMLRASFR